jgi:hypothetical protein
MRFSLSFDDKSGGVNAGPSTALRSAQDDSIIFDAQQDSVVLGAPSEGFFPRRERGRSTR